MQFTGVTCIVSNRSNHINLYSGGRLIISDTCVDIEIVEARIGSELAKFASGRDFIREESSYYRIIALRKWRSGDSTLN